MPNAGLNTAYRKYATWAIYGPKIDPMFALEVIRRTDTFFMNHRRLSPYQREVKRRFGIPRCEDFAVVQADGQIKYDMNALLEALNSYSSKWGCVRSPLDAGTASRTISFLSNSQLFCGEGWCYPDGTIAVCEEIKRGYPTTLCDECEAVAKTFPDLEFSVAYWGADGPEPSTGFIVKDGGVRVTSGDDMDLFGEFGGLDYRSVIEAIKVAEKAAREKLPLHSKFGDRNFDRIFGWQDSIRGVPDDIVEDWILRAQSLGLAPTND